ncbi:hypothetical protein [Turicimonas muris]|uniref:hypothetical protein n=1 Tax=Turicimonas muris TaxID=1796652 RepID=UPI002674C40E|nr:hypothetical protein [Turicimonas muris]
MRDKGTNEARVLLTDLTLQVLNWKVGVDSDASKNSIISRVMDRWARKQVMNSLRKKDKANLAVAALESYGVDPALLRQDSAK